MKSNKVLAVLFFGVLMGALAIFGAGSLVVSLSDSLDILLLGSAIQGFGSSGIFPLASAVVGDQFPPEKRGRGADRNGFIRARRIGFALYHAE